MWPSAEQSGDNPAFPAIKETIERLFSFGTYNFCVCCLTDGINDERNRFYIRSFDVRGLAEKRTQQKKTSTNVLSKLHHHECGIETHGNHKQ